MKYGEANCNPQHCNTAYTCDHCGVKANTCSNCKKSFGQAVFLKTHMISTLGRKCTNVQNVEIHLVENLHLLIHSGYKPHQCNECGKSFIKVGELKKHLCIYSLEKCTTAQNAITQVAITLISSNTKPNIQ